MDNGCRTDLRFSPGPLGFLSSGFTVFTFSISFLLHNRVNNMIKVNTQERTTYLGFSPTLLGLLRRFSLVSGVLVSGGSSFLLRGSLFLGLLLGIVAFLLVCGGRNVLGSDVAILPRLDNLGLVFRTEVFEPVKL